MTKLVAVLSALGLVILVGGTALYTVLAQRSDLAACGISSVMGSDLGGPFDLINSEGVAVSDRDVLNRPSLVYFGYTFCPDVCPFDMARNVSAVEMLKKRGLDVGLVFVTIDPARDTPEALAEYKTHMSPDMVALTGSEAQIRDAANAYRVHFARAEGDDAFYLVDHSTSTYLMFPGNRFGGSFPRAETAETIAEKSACLINNSRWFDPL